MAKKRQRETYGNGSVSAVTQVKKDKNGNVVVDSDGKPVRVQEKNKAGKPVWRVCLTLGTEQYVDKNGKLLKRQRKVQKRFAGTLKEAREYCKTLGEDYQTVDFDKARDNFSALCKKWGEGKHKCSEKQQKQYVRHLGYVAPYLDQKPIIEIKKADVESAIDGIERDKALGVTTLNKILTVVNRVFEFAVDSDFITRNPCRGIEPREAKTKQVRKALSEEEAAKLRICLDKAEEAAYQAFEDKEQRQAALNNTFGRSSVRDLVTLSNIIAMRLILATGARRGEVLGLQWANLDVEKGTVRICQTLNESYIVKQPKTDNGIRNLYVDSYTLEHLRKWKRFQGKVLHLINVDGEALTQDSSTPVFCNNNGKYVDPNNFGRWWNRFREQNGFDGVIVHEMRHTQVTLLLGNHIDLSMVQTRVGHSRPSSVTNEYLHELPARDKEAADVMGKILYETKVDNDETKGVFKLHSAA